MLCLQGREGSCVAVRLCHMTCGKAGEAQIHFGFAADGYMHRLLGVSYVTPNPMFQ